MKKVVNKFLTIPQFVLGVLYAPLLVVNQLICNKSKLSVKTKTILSIVAWSLHVMFVLTTTTNVMTYIITGCFAICEIIFWLRTKQETNAATTAETSATASTAIAHR